MSGGGTNKSLRKALGLIKDKTTVSLATINSDYKELDVSIVKATNHVERPAKERHIRAIFSFISASRPRADVAYCINALARRLTKTHNWAVALKTLVVIHRALREVDPSFQEELINYGACRGHMLNMAHFKDDSSPSAWEYSAWVRSYALFLEERMECYRILKHDVEADRIRTKDLDTPELLVQLPALQQLLYCVVGCQPKGAAINNFVIQLALAMVASESTKIYQAINDGNTNLVDKFFEMQRPDAVKALEIYKRAGPQAEWLSEFYEICKSLDLGRGERYIKIEQPPASFLQTMEEYVKEASRGSTFHKDRIVEEILAVPNEILAVEYKQPVDEPEEVKPDSPLPPPEPVKPEVEEISFVEPPDLLGLNDPSPQASELDEKNALSLAIVSVGDKPSGNSYSISDGTNGWELALVSAPSSNESATTASKLAGGLDLLTLDSLYEEGTRRNNQNVSYNPWEQQGPSAVTMMQQQPSYDPFFASNGVAAPHSVQMAAMANQQQALMYQQNQQMQMMPQQYQQQPAANPFINPYTARDPHPESYGPGMQPQAYNPYTGLI